MLCPTTSPPNENAPILMMHAFKRCIKISMALKVQRQHQNSYNFVMFYHRTSVSNSNIVKDPFPSLKIIVSSFNALLIIPSR